MLFCIHLFSLCVLVRTFNHSVFKVILEIYTYILKLSFPLFVGVDFPSLVCLDYISPFNTCCKAALVVLTFPNTCLSEQLLMSQSILNDMHAVYSNLGGRFSPPFGSLNIFCQSPQACRVSAESRAVKHMGFPL